MNDDVPPEDHSLSQALAYSNDEVVARFAREQHVDRGDAEELFQEVKKFLWLAATSTVGDAIAMERPMWLLDEMWHTFLLFTYDYAEFCETTLGRFVHHVPVTEQERRQDQELRALDPAACDERSRARLRKQYGEVVRLLGRDTLVKWLVDLPLRFPRVPADEASRVVLPASSDVVEVSSESHEFRRRLREADDVGAVDLLIEERMSPALHRPECGGGVCGNCRGPLCGCRDVKRG